jgi:hypothetical protein
MTNDKCLLQGGIKRSELNVYEAVEGCKSVFELQSFYDPTQSFELPQDGKQSHPPKSYSNKKNRKW